MVVSLFIAAHLTQLLPFSQGFHVETQFPGVFKLFVAVAVLAVINATLGKLIKLLTLPLTCLTLGLFSLVINAAMLMLVGAMDLGFKVDGFFSAFVGSILMSAIAAILNSFLGDEKEKEDR